MKKILIPIFVLFLAVSASNLFAQHNRHLRARIKVLSFQEQDKTYIDAEFVAMLFDSENNEVIVILAPGEQTLYWPCPCEPVCDCYNCKEGDDYWACPRKPPVFIKEEKGGGRK